MISGKSILIVGGTGSFGKHFTKIALNKYNPKRIIIFSRDELKQFQMRNKFNDSRLDFFIGDVRDAPRLKRAFEAGIDYVLHCAALKQIPACEYNPFEAVKTNILGAQNVIDAAIDCGISKVIALSTDKAVNPVNLYGATKLCAEKIFIHGNSYVGKRKTLFSCARYGNVFGSRGSVIPLFLKQREEGKITITDKRMTRFWITLDYAIEFIIDCLGRAEGREVFVPRLPSMNIMDLATAVAPNTHITFTGIRPGEKLHEILISSDEARSTIEEKDRFIIYPEEKICHDNLTCETRCVADDFTYASDSNEWWLTREDILQMLKENNVS